MTTAAFDDTEPGSGTRPPVTVPLRLVPADDVREVVTGHRTPAVALRVKAVLDVVAALVLVLVLLPLLLVVAGLVALDGGPVFFRQTRVGRDGREFRMIKFRSMVVDAEARLADLAGDGSGPLFKMRRDPRITRAGAVLRRYSLDELPQLFNVVAGTMSLVGPRPALPREVATYNAIARRRLAVKPGLTGLWQVSGRSDLSWDASIALDLRYVGQWTPGLDLKILARTARAVVGGRGAY
jgi:lipopolysaccharide/colanic/teichoic acid biosynthesis glycosyltransferase